MKPLSYFVFLTTILIFFSCSKNEPVERVEDYISYEELSFQSFEEAVHVAANKLYEVQQIRHSETGNSRNDITDETVENTGWLIEAMANLEFRWNDKVFDKYTTFDYTIHLSKNDNIISGAEIAEKYNELFASISPLISETKKLHFIDVNLDAANTTSTSAAYQIKGYVGNYIQYWDACAVDDDDYWHAGGDAGTCRPFPAENEFYGEKDASEREEEIINSPLCFSPDVCLDGTESIVLFLTVTGLPYNYDDSNLGSLYFSNSPCLTPDDMEDNILILRDILINSNPVPSSLDFLGMGVEDHIVITQGDIFNYYHEGNVYYAAFGCVEIGGLPPLCC